MATNLALDDSLIAEGGHVNKCVKSHQAAILSAAIMDGI